MGWADVDIVLTILAIVVLLALPHRRLLHWLAILQQKRKKRFISWQKLYEQCDTLKGTFIVNNSSISGRIWWTEELLSSSDTNFPSILYGRQVFLTNCPRKYESVKSIKSMFPMAAVHTVEGSVCPAFYDYSRNGR